MTPNRTCGECTLCCKLLAIAELQKPVDQWCEHCAIGSGCKIYNERPQPCRDFSCLWLDGLFDDDMKPSKVKAFFYTPASSHGKKQIQVHVDIARQWRGTKIDDVIRRLSGGGINVIVIQGTKRTFVKGEGRSLPQQFVEERPR